MHRLACCLLLATMACAGRAERPGPPAPRPVVELDEREVHALARLLQMEDLRVLDTALVAELLRDDTPEVRARVALAAGRVRDDAATPFLLRALEDPDGWVRSRAAFALGISGDTSAVVATALSRVALSDVTGTAIEAVAAAARVSAAAARPVIDSVLTGTRHHSSLVNEAATVAWRLPRDSATGVHLAALTRHTDPETRWRAAYALARSGSPAAVPVLLERVTDVDADVRAQAVRGLRAAHADSAGVAAPALEALLVAVTDSHPHVRINALRLLPAYRSAARTTPVLAGLLRDEDENVAVAAAQTLTEAADPAAAAALRAIADDASRAIGLRTAALAALARADAGSAERTALAWVDAPEWVLRRQAARTLAGSSWPRVSSSLQQLARDAHHAVAADALTAIRALADSLPEARRLFIEALAAEHVQVRAAGVRGLTRHATAADLDLLLQAWQRATRDHGRDAAIATLIALQGIAERGTPVERAFFLRFGQAGPPRDAALYRAVVQRIGTPPANWAAPDTAGTARPLSFYDDVVRSLVVPVLAGAAGPRVAIGTPHGEIVLELAAADAPLTVHNIITLIESGYYQGTRWHRVVPNFVTQDGERGDGTGGPGYAIRDEINTIRYLRGTLGMALSGPDTGGSQYFITHSPQPHLDGGYTVFGNVVDGMDAVDSVVQEEEILYIRVLR